MSKYAKVIIQSISDKLDKFFTYIIPDEMKDEVSLGSVVKLHFGFNKKLVFGFVFEILDEEDLFEDDKKYLDKIKSLNSLE